MNEEEIQDILEELHLVRPEILQPKAKKLFEAIMSIADERDELQQENKQLKEDYNKVVHEATAFESKVYELEERINKILDFINAWKKEEMFEVSMIDLMQIEEWLKGDPNDKTNKENN